MNLKRFRLSLPRRSSAAVTRLMNTEPKARLGLNRRTEQGESILRTEVLRTSDAVQNRD